MYGDRGSAAARKKQLKVYEDRKCQSIAFATFFHLSPSMLAQLTCRSFSPHYRPINRYPYVVPCVVVVVASSVVINFSGPNDIGRSCSSVMTVDFPSTSYMRIGQLSCSPISEVSRVLPSPNKEHFHFQGGGKKGPDFVVVKLRTSQNSRMNCLHIPHGLAGGLISVATAIARKSPFFARCYIPTVSVESPLWSPVLGR